MPSRLSKPSRLRLVIAAVTVLCLALTACGREQSPDELREKALGAQTGDIVIGVVWPFDKYRDQFREGLNLALEQINEKGVLGGKRIRLIEQDDGDSVIRGLEIAQQFAEDLSVSAVIGHRSSAVTVPASRIYDTAGILLMTPSSTSPNLTNQNSSFVFRNIPSDVHIGKEMAEYALDYGYRRIAIYYTEDEYGRGLANSFEDAANTYGLTIIDRLSGYKDSGDVRRIANKWKTLDCDLVLVAADVGPGLDFIRELRAAGFDLPVVGGDTLDSAEMAAAGNITEGTVVISVYHPDLASENNQEFKRLFREKYGEEPGKWAAQAYDTLHLLAYAIDQAGSRLPRDIARQLSSLEYWEGVAGDRSFGDNGDIEAMETVVKRLNRGTFELIRHTF